MNNRMIVVAALIIGGCTADYPNKHIAACEIEWGALTDGHQSNWGNSETSYIYSCMSAADFEYKLDSKCPAGDELQTYFASCYVNRQSLSYRLKHLLD